MSALYTHTTRGVGTILTATIYNEDHQNHIDNGIPAMFDDYSVNLSQMQSQVDPYPGGTPSLSTSLAAELERIRFAIAEMKGTTYWYEDSQIKALELIEHKSFSGGAVATADFEDGFTADFNAHLFLIRSIRPATDNQSLTARFKTASAYVAANYEYHSQAISAGAGTYNASVSTTATSMFLSGGIGNQAAEGVVGAFWLIDPLNAVMAKTLFGEYAGRNASTALVCGSVWGSNPVTTALQGLRFLFASGDIAAAGSISQYGVRA
jgi:hypothetical protein